MANINLLPVEYKEKQKFNLTRVLIILFIILLAFGSNLKKDKAIIEERVKVIEDLIANQFHLSRTLGEFSAVLLDEVWVDNLFLNANQTFDITANTLNNYLIAKCMINLKNDPTFDNIELGYVRKSKIIEENRDTEIVNFKLFGLFNPKKVE
jgi:Tfp pilus assembly protein PilN